MVNKISEVGIKLIKHFENCELTAYQDAKGVWTIGWGNTYYKNGCKVEKGDIINQSVADDLFLSIVSEKEKIVLSKVTRPLKQNEFDATVDFCYNAGTGYTEHGIYHDYNLWVNINNLMSGKDMFDYWQNLAIKSGGKLLNGLIRRRKSESHLYLTGVLNFYL
jgi:lysozyme